MTTDAGLGSPPAATIVSV